MPNIDHRNLRVRRLRSWEKFDCASARVVSFGNCGSTPVQQSVVIGQHEWDQWALKGKYTPVRIPDNCWKEGSILHTEGNKSESWVEGMQCKLRTRLAARRSVLYAKAAVQKELMDCSCACGDSNLYLRCRRSFSEALGLVRSHQLKGKLNHWN